MYTQIYLEYVYGGFARVARYEKRKFYNLECIAFRDNFTVKSKYQIRSVIQCLELEIL